MRSCAMEPTGWRQRLGRVARLVVLLAGIALAAGAPIRALAQLEGMKISELESRDRVKNEGQRKMVRDLAMRHLGVRLEDGEIRNLHTLQRLLDAGFVKPEETFEQQAMGVVLGDVMVEQLDGLAWVAVDDRYGHSRALRFRDTQQLFFPVTMISKRVGLGDRVEVQALYDKVAAEVTKLKKRSY